MPATNNSRLFQRSVLAIIAGTLAGILLSIGTDLLLRVTGVMHSPGQVVSTPILLLAAVYRTIYGVIGSYITARLAPFRPMAHSMVLGFMGLAANILGAIATWNRGPAFGPHWYPVTLIVLALPTAWVGAKLRIAKLRKETAIV